MRLWYSLALAVLATLWSGSATLGSGHQQQPVFRSGVDLVTVDVHVVDGSGQPIRDLRPDDFAVTVEGAARRVVAIDFVAYAPATGGVPAPGVAPAAPTPAPWSRHADAARPDHPDRRRRVEHPRRVGPRGRHRGRRVPRPPAARRSRRPPDDSVQHHPHRSDHGPRGRPPGPRPGRRATTRRSKRSWPSGTRSAWPRPSPC